MSELPSGWALVRLGELLDGIEAGKSFKCEERPPTVDEIGVVKVSAVTWGEYREQESKTCTEAARVNAALFVQPGDFLFSRANTMELVGACVIARHVTQRVMLSDKILRLRFLADPFKPWALHFLRSKAGRLQIEALSSGNQASMRNIGQERIGQIEVPLPPAAEQTRIVEKLEELLSGLDAGVAELKAAQQKLARYRQSLLKAAVQGELTAAWRGNTPTTGVLPSGWAWTTVGQLSEIRGGIQKKPSRAPVSNKFPFLRVANVARGRLVLNEVHHIELFDGELERFALKKGDVLVVEGNGSLTEIGRCAVWDGSIPNAVHQNHLIRVRPIGVQSDYLETWLNSPGGIERMTALAGTTSGLYTLSVGKIAKIPVPLPPLAEQQEIIRCLQTMLQAVCEQEAAIGKALAQSTAQRQNILRAAFSGQLLPQNPADEPASALLARIRAERAAQGTARKPRGRKVGEAA